MSKKIAVIPGDGIGPEVISSAVSALNALTNDIEMINGDAGYECFKRTGTALPRATMDILDECDAVLLGDITIPEDEPSFRNPLLDLKKRLNLYVDIRRVMKIVPDVGILQDIDAFFIRSSGEGMFNVTEVNELDGASRTIKVSYINEKRVCQYAKMFMADNERNHITCVQKTDLYPTSDGILLNTFKEVIGGSDLAHDTMGPEKVASLAYCDPRKIDTIYSINPYCDILSDSLATLTGGTHLTPVGLFGDKMALFKPLHNSHPTLEGKNIVNPTAMLLSTAMMLHFLGYKTESDVLIESIRSAYKRGYRTADVGGDTGTYDFTTQVTKICENQQ